MPTIRLERLAIRSLFLGLLGLDHLQLAYDPYGFGQHLQDHWYVMEGVRDPSSNGPVLSLQGADGKLTLARANTARDHALAARIGTPATRRHHVIADGPAAEFLWPRLVRHATAVAAESWPYVAYAEPASPLPTVNSTSLISSILHHAGYDAAASLPSGPAFMPGLETLLGTASGELMAATARHTTLMAGGGDDRLVGARDAAVANKLYGGAGDDVCIWSPAVAVCHGGQPRMPATGDGTDSLVFVAATQAVIGITPVTASADVGMGLTLAIGSVRTRIYSIEELRWSDRSDLVALAPPAFAVHGALAVQLSGETADGPGDVLDLAQLAAGASFMPEPGGYVVASASPHAARSLAVRSVETLQATPASDHLRIGSGLRRVAAGAGNDIVVVTPDARRLHVDVGTGADTLVLELAHGTRHPAVLDVSGGGADDRIVLVSSGAACVGDAAGDAPEIIDTRQGDLLTLTLTLRSQPGGAYFLTVRFHGFVDGHWGLRPGHAPISHQLGLAAEECPRQRRRGALGTIAEMMSNQPQLMRERIVGADGAQCEIAVHRFADGDASCRTPRAVGWPAAPARSRRALHAADRRPARGRRRRRRGKHRSRGRHAGPPRRYPGAGSSGLRRPARRLAAAHRCAGGPGRTPAGAHR